MEMKNISKTDSYGQELKGDYIHESKTGDEQKYFHGSLSSCINWIERETKMKSNTQAKATSRSSKNKEKLIIAEPSQSSEKCDVAPPRSIWTPSQDEKLVIVVEEEERETNESARNWVKIANILANRYAVTGRTAKQCRERWHNHLNPNVKKGPWSDEELYILHEGVRRFGQSWSSISCLLPGRTDNNIKNKYYCEMRKKHTRKSFVLSKLNGSSRLSTSFPIIPLLSSTAAPSSSEFFARMQTPSKKSKISHLQSKQDLHIDIPISSPLHSECDESSPFITELNPETPTKTPQFQEYATIDVRQSNNTLVQSSLNKIMEHDAENEYPSILIQNISGIFQNDIISPQASTCDQSDDLDIPIIEPSAFSSAIDEKSTENDELSMMELEIMLHDHQKNQTSDNDVSNQGFAISKPTNENKMGFDEFDYDNLFKNDGESDTQQFTASHTKAVSIDAFYFDQAFQYTIESNLMIDPWNLSTI